MSSSDTVQTPLPIPARIHGVLPPRELSDKEQAEYDCVLAHFTDPDYVLPGVDSASKEGALMEVERMWLSYECILRYIRATGHNTSQCINRLEATLKWRRDFGLYTLVTPEHVEPEALSGKMFTFGYDPHSRPIVYYYPNKQNTEESQRQAQFIFWVIERSIEFMGPGVESTVFIADFADKTTGPSFSMARQLVSVVQTHYPERLGAAIVARSPWFLHAFWKLVTPLMDPVTRSKLVFNPISDAVGLWRTAEARDEAGAMLAEADQLVSEGALGSVSFAYTHEVYWPALLTMCERRRDEMVRIWRNLGGVVGIREWDVKTGI